MAAAGASTTTRMRVFVGGLSGSVTASDVEKTFSSLGRVSGVEFVARPDGCSFAFMDFQPNSEKTLAKLFSTYNGCIWKGGRLKLEKAKEHYMDRLRREWAEAAEITNDRHDNNQITAVSESLEKSKCMPQENMQLKIFFPKFDKVKMLPFKGTGKHKYSFQRVEVPSLPVHFCDCEEHCRPSEAASKMQFVTPNKQISVIGKKELNVMHSVMSKLFEKEANENDVNGRFLSSKNTEILVNDNPSNERKEEKPAEEEEEEKEEADAEEEEEEAEETDAGNLVMNFGARNSNAMLDLLQASGWDTVAVHQDGKNRNSSHMMEKMENPRKRQKTGTNSQLELTSDEKANQLQTNSDQEEFPSAKPSKKEITETLSQEPQTSFRAPANESQMKQNLAAEQSSRGTSWVQKSSWKVLLGGANSSTFSMAHVVPGIDSMKPKLPKPDNSILTNSNKARKVAAQCDGGYSKHVKGEQTTQTGQTMKTGKSVAPSDEGLVEKTSVVTAKSEGDRSEASREEKTDGNAKPSNQPMVIGEVCTFMRSADSERQWTKARAVLSGHLKKKNNSASNGSNERSRHKS